MTKSFVLLTWVSLATDQFIKIESLFLSGDELSVTWEIRNPANTSQTQSLPVTAEGPRTGGTKAFSHREVSAPSVKARAHWHGENLHSSPLSPRHLVRNGELASPGCQAHLSKGLTHLENKGHLVLTQNRSRMRRNALLSWRQTVTGGRKADGSTSVNYVLVCPRPS